MSLSLQVSMSACNDRLFIRGSGRGGLCVFKIYAYIKECYGLLGSQCTSTLILFCISLIEGQYAYLNCIFCHASITVCESVQV